ncbi:DUF6603 domain-containing protein, partial [Streptomyces sp. NPDC050658]|uniref:DUF6603 domain-containing protein n=1 Tax=unclassified Streptomyces TaxID=2593676 RepID=UPI00341C271D
MTSIEASEQTISQILQAYGIPLPDPHAADAMPQVSLVPSVSTQQIGSIDDPDNPLVVYGESRDKQSLFILGGVKEKDVGPVYILLSASKHDPNAVPQAYLSLVAFIGGGVLTDYDIELDYVGTGLSTGTLTEADIKALNKNLTKLKSDCPLSFPSSNIENSVDLDFKKTPGFAFICLKLGAGIRFTSLEGSFDLQVVIPYLTANSEPSWANLGVALSKFYLRRIGITYETTDGGAFKLVVWLDGTVSFGGKPNDKGQVEGDGVTLEVLGFHLGIVIHPDYSWSLAGGWPDGLGLDYVRDPVQISGGFAVIRNRAEYDFLAEGGMAVSIPGLNVEALGAYARAKSGQVDQTTGEALADYPLIFFYALMQMTSTTKGTPPEGIEVFPGVMLTGVCFGLGLGCQLHVPDPAKVLKFPLVTTLTAGAGGANSPLEIVNKLTTPDQDVHLTWITPQDGGFWFAAGIAANIVEVFNIWGLAVVSIPQGGNWAAALIGTLDMVSFKGLFKVKAALEAEVSSELVAFGATLAPGSYIINEKWFSPSGGIDFYAYIGGKNKGQWVLTAGGYPSNFSTPPGYPPAPQRVGITYKENVLGIVDFESSIKAYLMFSNAGMAAGGAWDISLTGKIWKVELKIYFTLSIDFMVQWSPFYASISIQARIGGQVKLWVIQKKVEVSGTGSVWLPPFGGEVSVKLPFGIHPSFPFGDKPSDPDWLSWDDFVTQMLPKDGRLLTKAETGLMPVPSTPDAAQNTLAVKDSGSASPWNVSIHGFSFSTHCVVPSTSITVNGTTPANMSQRPLDVRPMGPTNA